MTNYLNKEDLQEKLRLSARQAAAMFNIEGFPYIRIGKQKLVREDVLDDWLTDHMGEEIKLDYSRV